MSIGHQAKDINAGLDFHGPPDILLMNAKNLGIYIKVNILPQSLAHNHPIYWDTALLTASKWQTLTYPVPSIHLTH